MSSVSSIPSKRACALLLFLTFIAPIWAKDKAKDKEDEAKTVDSGSFGVFGAGQRVATETFSISQGTAGSVITSQFKSAQGEQTAEQTSELRLAPSAELRSYEWKELSPGKTVATVTPDQAFLIERFGDSPGAKQQEQNFLLPTSTAILDDYFFVQREVLLWKYLATSCRHDQGPIQCPHNQKVQFGALNPHARASFSLTLEFAGRDKVTLHGTQTELSRFAMKSETGDWMFWLDDQLKLIRLVNDTGTEIVRD